MSGALFNLARAGAVAIALAGCGGRAAPRPAPASGAQASLPPANAAALAAALRDGGYVLFVRHAATDRGRDDARVVLEDCTTQRALSALGRAQAEAIASGLARLRIAVGEVRASPYCRAADTARVAFGSMLLDDDLLPLRDGAAPRRLAAIRRLLALPPLPGTNSALVGHGETFEQLAGIELGDAEAAVVRPDPTTGTWTVVGRIAPAQWSALP